MFETEDMLPRQPPEPSAPPLSGNGIVKPEVPEVSIIFGKPTNPTQIANQQPPSYAAWKRQVLPRVTSQIGTKNENINNANGNVQAARSAVFPLRAVLAPACEAQKYEHSPILSAEKTFRHSLENATGSTASLTNYTGSSEHRRSVDSLPHRSTAFSNDCPLTICASTQTDPVSNSKQELEYLVKAINDLQEEQRQTRRLLEAFINQHEQQQSQRMIVSDVFFCDMATQCDMFRENPPPNVPPQINFQLENGTVHQALPNVKIYSPVVKDRVYPTAQSTQYRDNTPLKSNTQQLLTTKLSTSTNPNPQTFPKASTEKSMVMNELALKYLPSDKLNELMKDTNTIAETAPLREIDNFSKAPTDISTASFHYLRKYRLLPYQQKQQINEGSPPQNGSKTPDFSPQYQQLHKSPMAVNAEAEPQHLDLEDIKRQPKFL